jgi:hypothetical protein
MSEHQSGGIMKKILVYFFIILLICAVGFFGWYSVGSYFKQKYTTNSTIECTNCTNINTTIIEPKEKSLSFNLFRWLTVAVICILLGWIIWLWMKYRAVNSKHTKEECIKAAREELRKQGKFTSDEPYFSVRYFGVYDEKNPGWAFIFFKEKVDKTKHFIHKVMLISCCVDAMNLEVFNEGYNRDERDLSKFLTDQGFGLGWPLNWPGKPERRATFLDVLSSPKSEVNLNLTPEQMEQQE